MSNYIPPDSHHVVLNFEDLITGDTNLNFGATQQNFADINAVINTAISAEIIVLEQAIADIDAIVDTRMTAELLVIEQAVCDIDARIDCSISSEIDAVQIYIANIDAVIDTQLDTELVADRIDEYCDIDTVIINSATCDIQTEWSIDNDIGLSVSFGLGFKQAFTVCAQTKVPWSKAVLIAKNGAIYFEDGLSISNAVDFVLEQAQTLSESIAAHFQQTISFGRQTQFVWQETLKFSRSAQIQFEDGVPLAVQHIFKYQELVRLRKQFTFAHEVAEQFQKTFSFYFDKALEITTTTDIAWQQADMIHYVKHPVAPWIKPEFIYEGDGVLNFRCSCDGLDPWNVILSFGQDDCMPYSPKKKWWYILNSIQVTRLDNGQPIRAISGTYESGRDRFCWSQSITVAPSEIAKLQPIDEQPVVLKIVINGFEQWMMLEGEPKEVRKFAETTFVYQGRSVTAKLTADYSAKRSYIQESQLYSKQLCEREIERVNADTLIDWQHIDELGWQVDAEGLSYTNLAPMDAIKLIVEAGGGFVYSQKAADTLTILPKYRKSHWEAMQLSDFDLSLSENVMLQHSIDPIMRDFDYNCITLINSRNGNDARAGFGAKDTSLPDATNPMFSQLAMAGYAKAELTRVGVRYMHTFSNMIVSQDIGEMLPGKIVSFDEQWWGVIDSVSGSWSHTEVWETVKVEQISHGQPPE